MLGERGKVAVLQTNQLFIINLTCITN